jgi:hypothetical protein
LENHELWLLRLILFHFMIIDVYHGHVHLI